MMSMVGLTSRYVMTVGSLNVLHGSVDLTCNLDISELPTTTFTFTFLWRGPSQ